MRCPSCLKDLQGASDACAECGFTLARLDIKFGTVPKTFRPLTDYTRLFTAREAAALKKAMTLLEQRFPGLCLSLIAMEANPSFNVRVYLFWLMNRCKLSPMGSHFEENFSLIIFLDATSRSVLLSTGYGLHTALPEESLQRLADLAANHFRAGHFRRGTTILLREIELQLRSYCKKRLRMPVDELPASVGAALETL